MTEALTRALIGLALLRALARWLWWPRPRPSEVIDSYLSELALAWARSEMEIVSRRVMPAPFQTEIVEQP